MYKIGSSLTASSQILFLISLSGNNLFVVVELFVYLFNCVVLLRGSLTILFCFGSEIVGLFGLIYSEFLVLVKRIHLPAVHKIMCISMTNSFKKPKIILHQF